MRLSKVKTMSSLRAAFTPILLRNPNPNPDPNPATLHLSHLSASALTSNQHLLQTHVQEHQRTQSNVNAALPPGALATLLAESRSLINKMSMLKGPEDSGGAQVRSPRVSERRARSEVQNHSAPERKSRSRETGSFPKLT